MGLCSEAGARRLLACRRRGITSSKKPDQSEEYVMRKIKHSQFTLAVAVLALPFLAAFPAHAQEPVREARAALCTVFPNEDIDGQLFAVCKGKAFVLGHADFYVLVENPGLEATIVDLIRNGERRVLMISFPKGEPLLEDITGTLAKSAGRGAMSGLKDVQLDFSSFVQDGKVRAASTGEAGRSGEVNMGLQIAAEVSRAGDIAAKN
jgi:hypothetical protein